MHIKIKRVFGSLYDLFIGDGWTDWTRVAIKQGEVKYIAGKIRSNEFLSKLIKDKK